MKGESEELRSRIRELEAAARVLEPDFEEREQLRADLVATSERFLGALDSSPAFVEVADPALGLLDTPIGETGIDLDRALGVLEDQVLRPGGHPASGAHLAYLTGGGMYHAALADYLAAVCNKYAGIFFTGPGPVRMENQVVRWVADLVGYPATAAGSILSGGSLANLTAVVAARILAARVLAA